MALTTCPECGREVSSKAATCPGCGAPVAASTGTPIRRGPYVREIFGWIIVGLCAVDTFSTCANPFAGSALKTGTVILDGAFVLLGILMISSGRRKRGA